MVADLIINIIRGYQILDELQIYSSLSAPVFAVFCRISDGDIKAGLIIGGSMQLTVLGVGTFGVPPKLMLTQARFLPQHFLCLLE